MSTITFDFRHYYRKGERRESDQIAYQWDLGHVAEIYVPVNATYEIHYCFADFTETDDYGVESIAAAEDGGYKLTAHIPNELFERSGELKVYVIGADDNHVLTTYEGYITIRGRAKPEDYVDDDPENEATRILTEAREARDAAVEAAEQAEAAASQSAAQASIAEVYDATKTYAIGDYCLHDGQLYECTAEITTPEAWTAAHWTAATVGTELNDIKGDVTGLKEEITQLDETVGIPKSVEKTIEVTREALNRTDTETPFQINSGETISVELTGSSIQSTTNSTLYFKYSDGTVESVNITSDGHKYTKTLNKNLNSISFYIINLIINGSLNISANTVVKVGLAVDVENLKNNKADIGIKTLTALDVEQAAGRINGTNGEVTDTSYFKHAIINVVGYNTIEFISATQGLSATTYGYAFYDASGTYISGSGISDTDVKIVIEIPTNAVTFKYGFYNPLWSDSKYTTFTLKTYENTIEGVQTEINLINGFGSNIVCFGDSLTQGNQDGTGNTYPKYLGSLLDKSVVNAGVGGENSLQIASRQGGIHLMVEPFTIPANTTPVSVTLSCLEHSYTDPFYIISQASGNINPVEIAGIVGTLTFTGNYATQTYTYTFTRNASGEEVEVTRPVPIVTATSKMKKYIQIYWVGTNDSPYTLENIQEVVVPRIDAMIQWTNAKNFIVIGLTAKGRYTDIVDCNTFMQRHFGTKFIDISRYILEYGLEDESIMPTTQDETDIANGEIPTSLRTDAVHFNRYGYDIVANQVYKRGKLLGYWS